MTTAKLTARRFEADPKHAVALAKKTPVVVTDNGRPTCVVLSYKDYLALIGKRMLEDPLGAPEAAEIDAAPRLRLRPVEAD